MGHPGRKEAVPGYVLRDFAKAEADWVENVLRGIADGAPHLADGDSGKFMNAVALRTAPPRSSTTAKKPAPKTEEKPQNEPEDARSPLQRLMDKFK